MHADDGTTTDAKRPDGRRRRRRVRGALTALAAWLAASGAAAAPGESTLGIIATPTCVGDCDDDGSVAVNELVAGVRIALGGPLQLCPAISCHDDRAVGVDCVVQAVQHALTGCPQAGVLCGNAVCAADEVCCDALFSVCAPPDMFCIH